MPVCPKNTQVIPTILLNHYKTHHKQDEKPLKHLKSDLSLSENCGLLFHDSEEMEG